ncbi:amidohydrolase [Actinokineospora guangxiensis]|uniref:Amidohydrolase n=1 Tax=Actinokineospora guangxiensis TaxID=1490288 RepID=A0ABW0EPZ0_9PSEU
MLDLLITGARVRTMDPALPETDAIGVWRGRVLGVGDAVRGLPAATRVDLGGAWVVPAFIDAHTHLAWAGLAMGTPSVAACPDRATLFAVVAGAAAQRPAGEWVDVVGYDQRRIGSHVTAAELDAVADGRRVHLIHDSGHACVVTSTVLDLLPGVPHRDGLLVESGAAAVRELRQPYSLPELVDALERASGQCLSEGVTACAEAGVGGGLIKHSPIEAAAYLEAERQGRLGVRVGLMVAADLLRASAAHPSDATPRAMDLGLRTGFGGERLSLGALKVFTDGGMMARTAALTVPYADGSGSGELYADPEHLHAVIRDAHMAGWQLAVHAIGDRAVDVALDGFEKARAAAARPWLRHRVEHAGLVRPDQLARFADLGVAAVVQPAFLWSFGDDYARIMGEERAGWLYRGRSFLEAGVRLVGSSDRPVTVGAPLVAMRFMVDRRSSSGAVVGPAEGITPEQALRAYTVDAAWACGWEDTLGSITPGKHADFTVLADDPLETFDTTVVSTVVSGEIVSGQHW